MYCSKHLDLEHILETAYIFGLGMLTRNDFFEKNQFLESLKILCSLLST